LAAVSVELMVFCQVIGDVEGVVFQLGKRPDPTDGDKMQLGKDDVSVTMLTARLR